MSENTNLLLLLLLLKCHLYGCKNRVAWKLFISIIQLHSIWKNILQKFVLLCRQKAWYTLMSFFFFTVTYIDHKVDHFSYFFIQFSTTSNMYMHFASTLPPPSFSSTLVKLSHTHPSSLWLSSAGAVWVISGLGVSIEAGGLTSGDTAKELIPLSLNVFLRNTCAQLWPRSPFEVDSWVSSVYSHRWATVTSVPLRNFSSFSSEIQCNHHTAIPFFPVSSSWHLPVHFRLLSLDFLWVLGVSSFLHFITPLLHLAYSVYIHSCWRMC